MSRSLVIFYKIKHKRSSTNEVQFRKHKKSLVIQFSLLINFESTKKSFLMDVLVRTGNFIPYYIGRKNANHRLQSHLERKKPKKLQKFDPSFGLVTINDHGVPVFVSIAFTFSTLIFELITPKVLVFYHQA